MGLSEFDIIGRYFNQPGLAADPSLHAAVSLGIGDDCAGLRINADEELMLSMDVLVAGVHFPAHADPADIARRALAVNLSDLAAMGASPVGFMLGLSLPEANENWLAGFSAGLRESAARYGCPLLGGNMTRASLLQIAIQVQGVVPAGMALKRSGARVGDKLFVSGSLGSAGLALQQVLGELKGLTTAEQEFLTAAYYQPIPRLNLGLGLRGIASAAIDISDGVLADVGHLASSSGVQVSINASTIPVASLLISRLGEQAARALALSAGDDYELAFTVPGDRLKALEQLASSTGVSLTCIGECLSGAGVIVKHADARPLKAGYDHFSRHK